MQTESRRDIYVLQTHLCTSEVNNSDNCCKHYKLEQFKSFRSK